MDIVLAEVEMRYVESVWEKSQKFEVGDGEKEGEVMKTKNDGEMKKMRHGLMAKTSPVACNFTPAFLAK